MQNPSNECRSHSAYTRRPSVLIMLAACISSLLAVSCSGSGGSDTGSVAFTIRMPQSQTQAFSKAAQFLCQEYGIATVEAVVLAYDGETVMGRGGPWPCDAGEGIVSGVKEGQNYTLTVNLRNRSGSILFRGSRSGITVVAGEMTDAGTIVPTSTNSPPVFVPMENQQVNAQQTLTFTVQATDIEDNTLTYSAGSLPYGASFNPDTQTFTWTPNSDQIGSYTVLFEVTDDGVPQLNDTMEVTITVGNANQPPVFEAMTSQQVYEGQELSFTVSATDPENDTLTYSVVEPPTGSEFDPDTQTFSWTPGYTQSGTHTVQFMVTDDGVPTQSDTLYVTITVINVNRAPVLQSIGTRHFTLLDGGSITVSAYDPDGDTLTYDIAGMPEPYGAGYLRGMAIDPGTHVFTWDPGSEDYGPGEYKVLFRVTDNGTPRLSDYEWVTIQVYDSPTELDGEMFPVLTHIGNRQVSVGQLLQFSVSATDADPTATVQYYANTIYGKTYPTGASLSAGIVPPVFTWSNPTPAGNYWVRFVANDNHDVYNQQQVFEDVVITVGGVNRPPTLDPIGARRVVRGESIQFIVTATDPENGALTFTAQGVFNLDPIALPSGASLNQTTKVFTWNTLADEPYGYQTIRITVTDAQGESDYEDIQVLLY